MSKFDLADNVLHPEQKYIKKRIINKKKHFRQLLSKKLLNKCGRIDKIMT